MKESSQLPLLRLVEALEGPPRAARPEQIPRLTKAEKAEQRERQGFKCCVCGGVSRGGRALDVIRSKAGPLAYCRSHRLQADAAERCWKGASKRRRGTKRKRKAAPAQTRMSGT